MIAEVGEGFGDVFVFAVAGEIDVEDVFPVLALRGAGFDLGEVDMEVLESLEGADEGARAVVDGEKDRGAVVASGRAGFFANDEEAGGVCGAILDRFVEDLEIVEFCGERAADGGSTLGGVVTGDFCGLGGG